jgi:hypothetical protein
MAIPTKEGKYRCSYCSKIYNDPVAADTCLANHNLIYVPLTQEDIHSFVNFLYTKDERNLTEPLVKAFLERRTFRQRLKE